MKHLNKFLTLEQLQALNTKRILAYKKKLHASGPRGCWEFDWCGCEKHKAQAAEWDTAMANAKQVLATREHVK